MLAPQLPFLPMLAPWLLRQEELEAKVREEMEAKVKEKLAHQAQAFARRETALT